ncbi:MAG: hypothetical protein EBU75_11305, partial [Betaproteobacteria bacterium]|nr:hypothetical protein [Betaproteobacteria bacterium]
TTGTDGSIYVAGNTDTNLDGQTNNGLYDAFLTKYNADGSKAWTKLLGAEGPDWANALTTGTDGSIYVAGVTEGNLDGQTSNGGGDAFLTKFDVNGNKLWTSLVGSESEDWAWSLSSGNDGAIYLAGHAEGSLDGQPHHGGADAFVSRYDANGNRIWTHLIGSESWEDARALTTGLDGAIYVAISGDRYNYYGGQG